MSENETPEPVEEEVEEVEGVKVSELVEEVVEEVGKACTRSTVPATSDPMT